MAVHTFGQIPGNPSGKRNPVLSYCSDCGEYVSVHLDKKTGDLICRECAKERRFRSADLARQRKWAAHVKAAEQNLNLCIREAARHGMSYGIYMACFHPASSGRAQDLNEKECPTASLLQ